MVSFIVDLCSFSPNGLYLACLIQTERWILVRNCGGDIKKKKNQGSLNSKGPSSTPVNFNYDHNYLVEKPENKLKVEHRIALERGTGPISEISWSPDSLFIGAGSKKGAVVSVHSLLDRNWRCRVAFGEEGDGGGGGGGIGLDRFWWGRDARHLICLSGEALFLSVWSIRTRAVHYIKDIASAALVREHAHGHSFSPDGSHLAVAHVDNASKFYIGIYSGRTWRRERSFYVASKDLAGISWSPSQSASGTGGSSKKMDPEEEDSFIVCWDTSLFSNLYIYNAQSGQLVKHYSPYGMATGFDSVLWSPSAHFLICTAHGRNEIHVLNGLTFGILIHDVLEPSYMDGSRIEKDDYDKVKIFSEVNENNKSRLPKYCEVTKWPTLEETPSPTKLHRPGQQFAWNKAAYVKLHPSGSYLACMTQLYPCVLWIYHLFSARVAAILIHENPVLDYDWSPNSPKLAIICSPQKSDKCSGHIYFWIDGGDGYNGKSSAYIRNVQIAPTKFSKHSSLRWSPQGDLLTVRDHESNRLHVFSNF